MSVLRLLNNGTWNKPPVLTAARKILVDALSKSSAMRPLGELASFLNGTSYDVGQITVIGTPIIRISNISDPKSEFLHTAEIFDAKYYVEPGELLVSWSASFKSIIWPGPRGLLNQHIFKVTETPGNNRGYIRHVIEAVFDLMQEKVVGIGMMHLRRGDFLGHRVPTPDTDTQDQVCQFLDWIESGCKGIEPALPRTFKEQRRIIARIEELSTKIEEAKSLRQRFHEECKILCRSIILQELGKPTRMKELLRLRECDVAVTPEETYGFAGVYCFGRGVFKGQRKSGSEFAYSRLTRLNAGNFVYPKLMAWEGALGIVPQDCEGLVVSPEFPVFEVDESQVLPETLDVYFRMPSVWPQLAAISTGTNVRRRRLHPSAFLHFEMPLPSLKTQMRLRNTKALLAKIQPLQEESEKELNALMPSILSRAFAGELL